MLRILATLVLAVSAVELHQSDFTSGTYRITEPGTYTLAEDITFSPNANGPTAYDSCWPTAEQLGTTYPEATYVLGFFAAITIETHDVVLDLNGHLLQQSPEHALLQRFFSLIELDNSPFLPGQGPHTFTDQFIAASQVTIRNGRLGRSSHHSIRGNLNRDITVNDVEFAGFEVAGLALNGVTHLRMSRCRLTNRKDVPNLGTFSAARFLQRYVDFLVYSNSSTTLDVRGGSLSAADVRASLRSAINNVFDDVMATGRIDATAHPTEYALFANTRQIVDGNSYGVLLNKAGIAVNDFPTQPQAPFTEIPSSDVVLNKVDVYNQESFVREVVALIKGGAAVSDSVGAILQLLNRHPDTGEYITITPGPDYHSSVYTGNPVSDAQLLVGKSLLAGEFVGSGLDNSRNGITADIIDWAEAPATSELRLLSNLTSDEGWQCNGDSMAHVQKGAIGFKIDATTDASLVECSVNHLVNHGASGSTVCGAYVISHPAATIPGYNGAHARGYTFAGSKRVRVRDSYVAGVNSSHGNALGFDVFTDSSDIRLNRCSASFINAQTKDATGFHLGGETSFSDLQQWCASLITAPRGRAAQVWDEEGVRNKIKVEHC